ncbi:MAG TPA: pyridoxamine 5'-phosphate oxidase family protein [Sedimentisphaerales bacterium]|jgi:general stress protein 26|nr:pyridoxamine 5'-phosphate oxidase family protein [Sedimentisphaerales bacterium]HNU31754.1 pyridoxamine 5'-phosphate oxidase family protein [Sedimentisphaerales bacterium]
MDQSGSNEIRQTCLKLISDAPVCYLTTLNADGYPNTTALGNLRCATEFPALADFQGEYGDGFTFFMSTDMRSQKIARIRANPKASVYVCDPKQTVGLTLAGEVEIVENRQIKDRLWQKDWTMFFPSGPQGPEYGIIKLVPRMARGWCRTEPFVMTLT